MDRFVKERNGPAGGPQEGQAPINPKRQASADQARVTMKSGRSTLHAAPKGLSGRGESLARHQPARHMQPQPSGEGQKHDPYDTDGGESLDTTIISSAFPAEHTPQVEQQQQLPGMEEPRTGDSDDEAEADSDDEESDREYEFDEDVKSFLADKNMSEAPYVDQIQFLQSNYPRVFGGHDQHLPTIDGDSYPTTTDGNPTEREEQYMPFSENGLRSPSLSSPRLPPRSPHILIQNQQSLQQREEPDVPYTRHAAKKSYDYYRISEQLRVQEQFSRAREQPDQQQDAIDPPTSQPPTYSQANPGQGLVARPIAHFHQETVQGYQAGFPQQDSRLLPGPGHDQGFVSLMNETMATPKHTPSTRTKTAPAVEPLVEPLVELAPFDEHSVASSVDYDPEVLFKMNYEQLKNESFDKRPQLSDSLSSYEMPKESLDQRLQIAHRDRDAGKQSKFLQTLTTAEWEEAGDWFLDRFGDIMKGMRAARQQKRKAAQEIEREVEVRHEVVAKKQKVVEDAMAKMKAHGEGLVPRTPRASKSPRPRKG